MAFRITNEAHLKYAAVMYPKTFHLAWGDLMVSTRETVVVTFTDVSNLLGKSLHGLPAGTKGYFSSVTNTTGIDINKWYYVIDPGLNDFKISETNGGPEVDFAVNGTGTFIHGTDFLADTWDDPGMPPTPSENSIQLFNEVGRQVVKGYVVEYPEGTGTQYVDYVFDVPQDALFDNTIDTVKFVNCYPTGVRGQFTTSGTLPTDLALDTDYWLIKSDNGNNRIASSLNNAKDGIYITLIDNGVGEHEFTVDPVDLINAVDGYWILSAEATPHIYLQFAFDRMAAGDGKKIHQVGLFMDTVIRPNIAPGVEYFTPGDLLDKGSLIMIDNMVPIIRDLATYETFDVVISF